MRRVLVPLLLSLTACAGGAENVTDFELVNDSSRTINRLYLSAARQAGWGADLLGNARLAAGESVRITLPSSYRGCSFDVRVVYSNYVEDTAFRRNLCRERTLTWH